MCVCLEGCALFHIIEMIQGQTRVIIYTPFVQLQSSMLRVKFQNHWTSGSGDFNRLLPYMCMVDIFVMGPGQVIHTFIHPSQGDSTCFLALAVTAQLISAFVFPFSS